MRSNVRILVWLLLVGTAGSAWAASPVLSVITPRGAQRGAETELTFHGARLADAQEIFFYEPGFEVVKLEAADAAVKAVVKVAADCRLGEHVAQVRTASGISEYRSVFVGPYPSVAEVEPNSLFEQPQAVELNVTVEGIIENEDVDYFVVNAKKGQRLSLVVEGMRLGATLFDPSVAILDERRFELASADDSPLAYQDPVTSALIPEDGKYIVELRESSYGGNGACRYRIHIGTFPCPTVVYPAGGKLGEQLDVTFVGDPAGPRPQTVTLPGETQLNFALHAQDESGVAPIGNAFRLSEHGNVLEVEPNEGFQDPTPAELPLVMNGIIQQPGDVDCFKFAAKKGQVFEVECYARRVRSPLDPLVNLYFADGRGITGNDDARGPDSYFRFEVPEDAEYVLRVTDHLGRGGADFVYRVEFQPIVPSLTLSIPRVALYSQYRQSIYVPRGGRFATLIAASRVNFGGELLLDGKELPPGVKMICDPMPANMTLMPVVFEAAADAPLGGKLVDFTAHHADTNTGIQGGFTNRADMIIAPPGQSLFWYTDVNRLAMAVVEELPFTLEIVQPNVPLVRDGSMQLKIVAHRKEGFTAPITVEFPFLPPGVGAASNVTIPEGQTEVLYPLNANGGAAVGNWGVYAIGSADVSGPAWSATQLARLEIAVQPVTFALERASCEQGQEAQIYCKITHNTPFEGAAKVNLIGLPAKVTTDALEFTKDTQELVFKLKTDPESPVGQHKNIFGQIVIMQNGEPITLAAGSTELQIDKPLPAPTTPAPMPAAAAAPAPMPEQPMAKPLSRLEKLRQAARERQAGGGTAEPAAPAP